MMNHVDLSLGVSSIRSLYELWAHGDGLVERLAQLGPTLVECAAHVEAGSIEKASRCLARVMGIVAGTDGPMQRLARAMADILARRVLRPVPAIAGALMDPADLLDWPSLRAARRVFFDLNPFPKVAFVVVNRAILEALDNEKHVHVIDLAGPAAQPWQWVQLLRDLHRRSEHQRLSGETPRSEVRLHLRLTVLHDDEGLLAKASDLLRHEALELDMAFQFHGVVGELEALDSGDLHRCLGVRSGEACAVICTLQLHRLLAADDAAAGYNSGASGFNQMVSIAQLQQMAARSCPSEATRYNKVDDLYLSPATPLSSFVSPPATTPHLVQTPAPMASFLSAVRALCPKIVVVTEQDASHNGVSFRKRFDEALHYYAAVFDVLDAAAEAHRPRSPAAAADNRARAERVAVGEEMKGLLLREGAHRRERHDRLHQWALRMQLAGFSGVPLSYIAIRHGNDALERCGLLRRRCESREHGGCLLLCWSSTPLYSVSAWRPSSARPWPEASAGGR